MTLGKGSETSEATNKETTKRPARPLLVNSEKCRLDATYALPVGGPWRDSILGSYAREHAAAHQIGFPSALPCEPHRPKPVRTRR